MSRLHRARGDENHPPDCPVYNIRLCYARFINGARDFPNPDSDHQLHPQRDRISTNVNPCSCGIPKNQRLTMFVNSRWRNFCSKRVENKQGLTDSSATLQRFSHQVHAVGPSTR